MERDMDRNTEEIYLRLDALAGAWLTALAERRDNIRIAHGIAEANLRRAGTARGPGRIRALLPMVELMDRLQGLDMGEGRLYDRFHGELRDYLRDLSETGTGTGT